MISIGALSGSPGGNRVRSGQHLLCFGGLRLLLLLLSLPAQPGLPLEHGHALAIFTGILRLRVPLLLLLEGLHAVDLQAHTEGAGVGRATTQALFHVGFYKRA